MDGTRYVLIAQPRTEDFGHEERARLEDPEAKIRRFYRESEWRRKLSLIWQEDNPGWKQEWVSQNEQSRKTMEI
jgi:hypothetical protein